MRMTTADAEALLINELQFDQYSGQRLRIAKKIPKTRGVVFKIYGTNRFLVLDRSDWKDDKLVEVRTPFRFVSYR